MRRADGLLLCAAWLGIACLAHALPPELQQRAATLPSRERDVLSLREATLRDMAPAQRDALRQRLAAWRTLPEAERRARRERWQAWQALPAGERAQVRAAALAFAALPVERQLAMRTAFAARDESERRGWLLGPALGGAYPRLQPLLAQVPGAQREPLLAVLRALAPQQLIDLGVLAQRTPPQQRDELRRALISTSEANRAAWLQLRLDQ